MFKLFFGKITTVMSLLFGCISLFLFGRNAKLKKDNNELNAKVAKRSKTIDIQRKVINVTQNTKAKPIADNIDRMRKGKL